MSKLDEVRQLGNLPGAVLNVLEDFDQRLTILEARAAALTVAVTEPEELPTVEAPAAQAMGASLPLPKGRNR